MNREEKARLFELDLHTLKKITLNDVSKIYNHNPLSDRFCDNIIFYNMVPVDANTKNKNEYLSKFLAEHTSNIKRILQSHNIDVNKRYIKPTCKVDKVEMKVSILTISTLHKTSQLLLTKKR
ncbi:hypothetical protein M9Y10_032527 [Tritrichomonas musculus]|uniref:Uncharacterized protein n=1 Tax=Tritrichomonas musculus TaxID=1915356 RepID=A0ABR2H0M3_9EUKA